MVNYKITKRRVFGSTQIRYNTYKCFILHHINGSKNFKTMFRASQKFNYDPDFNEIGMMLFIKYKNNT